ncbi:MAG: ferritin-like domain-containing protein, partial [Solirubrobacteraceae bacterium]
MSHLNLEVLDADGAIRESAEAAGLDRSDFLKKGVLAGGGLIAGSAMFGTFLASAEAAISTKKRSKSNDVKILNYALTLEYLESTFYEEAKKKAKPSGELKALVDLLASDEKQHVEALEG